MKKRQHTRDQMYKLIDQWSGSGMKQEDFCNTKGISFYKFKYYRWRRNKQAKVKKPAFIPVSVSKETTDLSRVSFTIRYPNGVEIDHPGAIDKNTLTDFITVF